MTAELRALEWRLPGCGAACRESRAVALGILRPVSMILHDPAAHEDYGRLLERQLAPSAHMGVVRTGGIGIDHERLIVTVDGVDSAATPTEVRIMLLLSAQFNRTFTTAEILRSVWDSSYVANHDRHMTSSWAGSHMLRVNVTRLRVKLGRWRHLLVTQPGIGFRLDYAEVTP